VQALHRSNSQYKQEQKPAPTLKMVEVLLTKFGRLARALNPHHLLHTPGRSDADTRIDTNGGSPPRSN
jgi:hypothetical protein